MGSDAFDWTTGQPILTDDSVKTAFDHCCKEKKEVSHIPYYHLSFIDILCSLGGYSIKLYRDSGLIGRP